VVVFPLFCPVAAMKIFLAMASFSKPCFCPGLPDFIPRTIGHRKKAENSLTVRLFIKMQSRLLGRATVGALEDPHLMPPGFGPPVGGVFHRPQMLHLIEILWSDALAAE
jgi:hypothetical protein